MRHAKKMIMVPEAEYLALFKMLKANSSGDYLENEKTQLEADMHETLNNPKISEDLKAKKYSWLHKQRQQLKHKIENKPLKVHIDQEQLVQHSLAPYLGVEKIEKPRHSTTNSTVNRQPIQSTASSVLNNSEEEEDLDNVFALPPPPTTSRRQRKFVSASDDLIDRRYEKDLRNFIRANGAELGVNADGKIIAPNKGIVTDSSIVDSVKFLTGQIDTPPKGHKFLLGRLNKNAHFQSLVQNSQKGKGKKRVIVRVNKIKPIKKVTQGLQRKAFKPQLWERL